MGEWEGTVVYSWKLFHRHSFITNNLFVLENDCDEMNTELRDMLKYQLLGANSYALCRTMSQCHTTQLLNILFIKTCPVVAFIGPSQAYLCFSYFEDMSISVKEINKNENLVMNSYNIRCCSFFFSVLNSWGKKQANKFCIQMNTAGHCTYVM